MREWLEQYPYLCAKAERLKNEMDKLRGNTVVCGSVQSSSPLSPYSKHNITVIDTDATEGDRIALAAKRVELDKTQEEMGDIERYIEDEPDLRMKEILTRKVIYGEKWAEVAAAFGYKETEGSVKKAYYRHFK